MSERFEDLNARARGLATHFIGRAELEMLTRAPALATLGDALRRRGYPLEEGESRPAVLELALRRVAAARLRILARWSGRRAAVVVVLFEDEDRRSLRALLRGAVQGAAAEARLVGLVPTPSLPERALGQLARQRTPGAIAGLLTAWRHPYGSPLFAAASATQPDVFTLELIVNRTFALRASRAARQTPLLAAYVREGIDLENAYTALALASEGRERSRADAFLAGGARLSPTSFAAAARAGDASLAARDLARAFAGTALGLAFTRAGTNPAALEAMVLGLRIRALKRTTRTDPLGPAPLIAFALELRAELMDLERVIWGLALGVPADALAEELVTAS